MKAISMNAFIEDESESAIISQYNGNVVTDIVPWYVQSIQSDCSIRSEYISYPPPRRGISELSPIKFSFCMFPIAQSHGTIWLYPSFRSVLDIYYPQA